MNGNKTPISLIVDDPAPRVFVYYEHAGADKRTLDGRPLRDNVPNAFLDRFCDLVERRGIRGKYSVVPIPGGRGRVDGEIPGFPREEIAAWLETVNARLKPFFDFCPEMLTHAGYLDLATGKMMDEQENLWSFRQDAETLTEYRSLALEILKNAGIDATGFTSPWDFGEKNEDAYARAVGRAMERVWGRKESWYFCRSLGGRGARPWIAAEEDGRRVAAIPGTIGDMIWQAMDTTDTSEEYVDWIADLYITENGKYGEIPKRLAVDSWPILTVHWQSLFSNGAETGLRVLDRIAGRVERALGDRVEWRSFGDLMRWTMENR